jgi:outer membrane protein
MKKLFLLSILSVFTIACNQPAETKSKTGTSEKTAFVDTAKLFEEYTKVKELETELKSKSDKMGADLEKMAKNFQFEVQSFQKEAQMKGPEWAKNKQGELMAKEQQLQQMQQSMQQEYQKESAAAMDSLYKNVKKLIGEYGKKNGYTYIYGTGEPASILYGKEELDITKEILKELNKK